MSEKSTLNDALREKVRLNVGIVGCGNAGSQLVDAAFTAGFTNVFCVNTSQKDMDDSVVNRQIPGFLAGNNGRGAGMDRDAAKKLFQINYKDLFENAKFIDLCDNSDVIVVGCSCSGGSGSGIAPVIVKALKATYPGKIVIFYGIFPRLSASVHELSNSMSCIQEIETLAQKVGIPYMLADLNYFDGQPNEKAFPGVISKMVSDIEVISGKFLNFSQLRMIDENDTRVIISPSGYMSIYRVDNITQQMLDKESAQQLLLKQIKHSVAMNIARDGLVEQMAFISNMPADMEDDSKAGDYSDIISYVGRPLSIFENYAVIEGGTGQMIMIMSGQSYPIGHMTMINNLLKEAEENRKAKLEARKTYDRGMKGTYSFLESSGSPDADLLGEKEALTGDAKTAVLDGLFDD